jgi:hypothetical protein
MKKNEKLLIGFTCFVDLSVSSAKRYLCVIHSGSQKRIGTRKSSASSQASVTCFINEREVCSRKVNYSSAVDVHAVSTLILSSDGSATLWPIT